MCFITGDNMFDFKETICSFQWMFLMLTRLDIEESYRQIIVEDIADATTFLFTHGDYN